MELISIKHETNIILLLYSANLSISIFKTVNSNNSFFFFHSKGVKGKLWTMTIKVLTSNFFPAVVKSYDLPANSLI